MSQNKTLYLEKPESDAPLSLFYTDETGNTRVSGSPDFRLPFL
ncbi:hypothetical protein NXW13_00855 [Bacteroides thetaiotaomicron]|nr:hypothetical protein [Bacteroides thetaiotaomicron]